MSASVQTTPRRRGRPPKVAVAINPQFPGRVIPITSKPRLRVGCICEMRASRFPQNLGARVEIVGFREDGRIDVRALDRPLHCADLKTNAPNGEDWNSTVTPDQLYRIGHR